MKTIFNTFLALLLFTIAIAQFGCKKETNTEYPDVTATADTVSGVLKYRQADSAVVSWPYGTATFKVIAGTNDVLASAAVNADGTFTLILPGKVAGGYLSSLTDVGNSQGGGIKTTPETTRFLGTIQYIVDYSKNGSAASIATNLFTIKTDQSVENSYFFNFYDRDGTFKGTATAGHIYNWEFTKGWGIVENSRIDDVSEAFNSRSVSEIPQNAVWVN